MQIANIEIFKFEQHSVRTVRKDGDPLFNALDVCEALGYGNPHDAIARHVDSDDLCKHEVIDSMGRSQATNHVNESGLYALVFGSKLPKAKAFKNWVTSEVLPSIRKTGSYGTPPPQAQLSETQDKVTALLMIGKAMALVEGVRPGIMAAQTLECIAYNTGLNTDLIRLALPAAVGPRCSLNATNLGKHIGLSGKATNLALYSKGLQQRNDRDEWELTEAGKQYAEALPYVKRGHSGYQILWDVSVARIIQETA